jgi:hypothetical protein
MEQKKIVHVEKGCLCKENYLLQKNVEYGSRDSDKGRSAGVQDAVIE